MRDPSLEFLLPADWALLREQGVRERHPRDAVILREGTDTAGLLVLREGAVRVLQNRGTAVITLARLGPGAVLGEMSFLEDSTASAAVVADEPVVLERFDRLHLLSLLQADPGFAARFYQSLAVLLARRLRARSRTQRPVNGEVSTPRDLHLGHLSARQIPRSLAAGVDAFRTALARAELRLAQSPAAAAEAQAAVRTACDGVLALLDAHLRDDVFLDAGIADLGAFRDPELAATGIGAYVFRQTFSAIMGSVTAARAYARPRGITEDWETIALIHMQEPDGDGLLGPLVDRWVLDRPWCVARRAERARGLRALRELAARGPASATLLGSGVGDEAVDAAAGPDGQRLRITCVDRDEEALVEGAQRARDRGVEARVHYLQDEVSDEVTTALHSQQLVLACGLLEHLDDAQAEAAVRRAWRDLAPGGTLLATNLADDSPDRALLDHLFGWRVFHRDAAALERLVARAGFVGDVRVERDGADLVLSATRRS